MGFYTPKTWRKSRISTDWESVVTMVADKMRVPNRNSGILTPSACVFNQMSRLSKCHQPQLGKWYMSSLNRTKEYHELGPSIVSSIVLGEGLPFLEGVQYFSIDTQPHREKPNFLRVPLLRPPPPPKSPSEALARGSPMAREPVEDPCVRVRAPRNRSGWKKKDSGGRTRSGPQRVAGFVCFFLPILVGEPSQPKKGVREGHVAGKPRSRSMLDMSYLGPSH